MEPKKDMTMEEVVSKMFLMWSFSSMQGEPDDPELLHRSFIANVLVKKMEAFETGIVVPAYLGALIDLCTDSNPGVSQIILSEIIEKAFIDQLPYTLTPDDFVRAFPTRFPVFRQYEDLLPEYERKWDAQKVPMEEREKVGFCGSDNQVDTPEYWKELVDRSIAESAL